MPARRLEPIHMTFGQLYAWGRALTLTGWTWKQRDEGDNSRGWWTHPTILPHRAGDPKEYWVAVKTTYMLYTEMPTEGIPPICLEHV